jgi:hypothetical protein
MFTTPYQSLESGLTMNCVVNVARITLLSFYIFKVSRMWEDYIKLCKPKTCMAMQKKLG